MWDPHKNPGPQVTVGLLGRHGDHGGTQGSWGGPRGCLLAYQGGEGPYQAPTIRASGARAHVGLYVLA